MSAMRSTIFGLLAMMIGIGGWSMPLHAGIHNTAEPPIPLNDSLEQFLKQLNRLRALGPPDALMQQVASGAISEDRKNYLAKIEILRAQAKQGPLSADELANLGAYLYRVRTTNPRTPFFAEAIEVLEQARRIHPRHFAIVANLGTVYQMSGALDAAESCLESAYSLAPPEWQKFEKFHWLLVKRRFLEKRSTMPLGLDHLFDLGQAEPLRFVGPAGVWQIGQLHDAERQKLPGQSLQEATKIVQQLLVWLPEDARLHWLLAELANAQGQTRAAAEAMSLAVNNFRFSNPDLKLRRFILEEALVWQDVAQRLGTVQQQAEWVAECWFSPIPFGMPGGLLTPDLLAIAALAEKCKMKQNYVDLANGLNSDSDPKVPPVLFSLDQIKWYWWGIGGLLILGLLYMQFREWGRKLRGMLVRRNAQAV